MTVTLEDWKKMNEIIKQKKISLATDRAMAEIVPNWGAEISKKADPKRKKARKAQRVARRKERRNRK